MGLFLQKFLTYFVILPPGNLVPLLLLAAFFLRASRVKSRVFLAAGLLLYAISIDPVRDFAVWPLESAYAPWDGREGDIIMVFGGGNLSSSPEEHGLGSLMPSAMKRHAYAAALYRKTGLPVLTSGGIVGFRRNGEPEGTTGARFLEAAGVPAEFITAETESRTTLENVELSLPYIEGKRVIAVSSATHMPRVMQSLSYYGVKAIAAPTDYCRDAIGYDAYDFLPRSSALDDSAKAIKEYTGLAVSFVTGAFR